MLPTWTSSAAITREYQVQVDPNKLIDYGLNIAQVEQALAANNVNAGGSFIEKGQQAFNVRVVGLMQTVDDVGATVLKAQNGTPVRVRDVAVVTQGAKIRLGKLGKARASRRTARSLTTMTWWRASCCCAKAPTRKRPWRPCMKKWTSLTATCCRRA